MRCMRPGRAATTCDLAHLLELDFGVAVRKLDGTKVYGVFVFLAKGELMIYV